ncbi:hypothetical protein AAHB50_14330 [Bacillus toyonensis]
MPTMLQEEIEEARETYVQSYHFSWWINSIFSRWCYIGNRSF